jgi:cellulose synthase/poly-beta-1,6-N-acetylglucosamine synthase-like glycosyltransferase/peptidoglycan/xylan/chitin deacetylase (PgdA/CDA1 family)
MPIFLDNSRRRKFYFRGATAFFLFVFLSSILLFCFGLSFAASTRSPVSYADAAERYHYYYSAANDKKVAITVDDGPHAPATEQFLSTLKLYNVPATFFYIGEQALLRPDLVKEAADAGFDIEVHSFSHAQSAHSSYERLAFELHSSGYLVSQITGTNAMYYRPPFLLGIGIDPTVNPYIEPPKDVLWSLEAGYLPVGSDIDPKDWLATSTPGVMANLKKALHDTPNGHIILLHEDVTTARAMGDIVTYLRDQGYTIVPLKELLTPPTIVALGTTLKTGDTDKTTGGAVSKLQWFLYKQKYLDPYELTGIFDTQTKEALTNFQITNKLVNASNPDLPVVGVATPATRALIANISAAASASQHSGAVHAPNLLEQGGGAVVSLMRDVYVHFFPLANGWLVVIIFLTLLLVLGRSLGLIALIIWAKIRNTPSPPMLTAGHPGVSILIPAYNEQENIAATVESVIRTSYPRREIIVIDDGSRDNTSAEVEGVIRAYPNDGVRLVRVENGGKARALNIGMEYAQYEIIVVLDADAVLDKEALWHFTKHFSNERVGAVAGKVCTTGSSTLLDLFQTLEYAVGQNIDKRAFSTMGAVGVVPGPAGAWRKSVVMQLGGFSTETLVEDQDLTLTVLRSGRQIIYEPDAIAYTETPHNVKNFLKQRFRWVYGTMQCFWKHKSVYLEKGRPSMTLIVLPNIFIFNMMLPLIYPFADSAFIFGLFSSQWQTLILPFLLFTAFDLTYAMWGVWGEPNAWRLMLAVPLQRIVYRQLLYISVMRSVVRALEGTGSSWNKFAKMGETKRFFFTSIVVPVPSTLSHEAAVIEAAQADAPANVPQLPQVVSDTVTVAFQGPSGTSDSSTNLQRVVSLSSIPKHFQSAGDISSPAWAPNVLVGVLEEPKTYEKSSSLLGPTSSH